METGDFTLISMILILDQLRNLASVFVVNIVLDHGPEVIIRKVFGMNFVGRLVIKHSLHVDLLPDTQVLIGAWEEFWLRLIVIVVPILQL